MIDRVRDGGGGADDDCRMDDRQVEQLRDLHGLDDVLQQQAN